jgi:GH25 family lysozyme M1 (1,4-beta-N-acetylmuramidase)
MTISGIDLSDWQKVYDWSAVPTDRYQFGIVKCTEGADYFNEEYHQQIAGLRSRKMGVGHYIFNRLEKWTAKQEIDYFLSHADIQDGEPVALDIEEILSSVYDISDLVNERAYLLEKALGFSPMMYTYPWYFTGMGLNTTKLTRLPLWYAQVSPSTWPAARNVYPWPDAAIHQYTTELVIPGIGGSATVDGNHFKGTLEDFRALGRTPVVVYTTTVDPGFPGAVQKDRTIQFNGVSLPGDGRADQVAKVAFTLYNVQEGTYYNVTWDNYVWSNYSVVGQDLIVQPNAVVDPGFPDAIQRDRSVVFNGQVLPGAVADRAAKVVFTLYSDEDKHYYEITWDNNHWSGYRIVG